MLVTRPVKQNCRENNNWMPSILSDFFEPSWPMAQRRHGEFVPAMNIVENEKDYQVEMAVPGMTKENLTLRLDEANVLTASAEKKVCPKTDEQGEPMRCQPHRNYLRREFCYRRFEQSFNLPEDVDKNQISATLNDGILTIVLPKVAPEECAKNDRFIEIG